jgi:hypothetical protein
MMELLCVMCMIVWKEIIEHHTGIYKKSTGDTLSFRVAQKHPIKTPLTPHCEAEWVDILRSIQLKHKKVCSYE